MMMSLKARKERVRRPTRAKERKRKDVFIKRMREEKVLQRWQSPRRERREEGRLSAQMRREPAKLKVVMGGSVASSEGRRETSQLGLSLR